MGKQVNNRELRLPERWNVLGEGCIFVITVSARSNWFIAVTSEHPGADSVNADDMSHARGVTVNAIPGRQSGGGAAFEACHAIPGGKPKLEIMGSLSQ